MLLEILSDLFERDLNKLKSEIEQYSDETDLWKKPSGVPNSAGNLCLHLNGNLQHFIGATLGGSGYVRDRDAEFSLVDVPREKLLGGINSTLSVVKSTMAKLTDADLIANYPIEVFGHPMTTGWFLTYLATHLTWHLGQINYHRRML